MADAALTSFAMYAIGFSIVPSVIGITLTVMNNLAVGGARLWVKGCVATLFGIGTGALLLPWEFHLTSSLLVQAASLSLAAIYLIAFGWTMWCRRVTSKKAAMRCTRCLRRMPCRDSKIAAPLRLLCGKNLQIFKPCKDRQQLRYC